MKIFVLFLLLISSSICFNQKPVGPLPVPDASPPPSLPREKPVKYKPPKLSVKEKLESYILGAELEPWFIVNNIDRPEEKTEITVGGHKIKWSSVFKEETKIDIDGDVFSLKDKLSLNSLQDGDGADEVDFANRWDQIKLFQVGDRQLIGISMFNHPCTGIGCSVSFFLIYDLKTKSKSFFGSFRVPLELKLYDFGNDGTIDFLGATYNDRNIYQTGEIEQIYGLYTMDEKGSFKVQSDKSGKKYFFKRTFKDETYKELDKKFVHNWVEEIK